MSRTPREKFLAHLKKTMVHGETATERAEAMKLYAAATSGLPDGAMAGGAIPLPDLKLAPVVTKRVPSEFDEAIEFLRREHPDDGLFALMMLVQPPRFMAGLWNRRADGWHDERTNTDLTFDDARVLVADRIAELGLSPEKVWAYPKTVTPLAEYQVFLRMDFDQQMSQFK
jgi:hypothetical protein